MNCAAHARCDSSAAARQGSTFDLTNGVVVDNRGMDLIQRYFVFFICLVTLGSAFAQDILGCGGFLKSHADIDFTKVHVKL